MHIVAMADYVVQCTQHPGCVKCDIHETKIELPVQISLIGHSAGGQMCAMALLHRAKALSKHRKHEGKASGQETGLTPAEERMPARFIGEVLRAGRSSV